MTEGQENGYHQQICGEGHNAKLCQPPDDESPGTPDGQAKIFRREAGTETEHDDEDEDSKQGLFEFVDDRGLIGALFGQNNQ